MQPRCEMEGGTARAQSADAARARRLDAIVENAIDVIISIDSSQRIVLFNRAAEQAFGYRAQQMIGQRLEALLPPDAVSGHARHVERFGALPDTEAPHAMAAAARPMGRGARTVQARRANGELFPIEASISKVIIGSEPYYTVILRDVTERERAAAELEAARAEIQRLSAVAHLAREGEHRRLAQQLHDNLAQDLAALKFALASLGQGAPVDAQTLAARVGDMSAQLDQAMATTRHIASELQPLLLDDLGLQAAVEWLIERFGQHHRAHCSLVVQLAWDRLDKPAATAVFRVLQEALDNVVTHSQAEHVAVELRDEGDAVRVRVYDDGQGFDARMVRPEGVGLIDLADRLRVLGGMLQVDSSPGRGTTLTARVPSRIRHQMQPS